MLDVGAYINLDATLQRQELIVARRQLLAAGLDDVTVSRRVRRGEWQRLLPGIYAASNAPITTEQRRVAAAIYAGENAQLTGLAALHWYGFRFAPSTDRVHMLVPHERRRRSTGFAIVQRTLALDSAARDAGLYTVVAPARAVVDACRLQSDVQAVRAIMAEAVQRPFTNLATLDDEVRRAGRSRTALPRRVFNEIVDGVRSSPEAELRELASTSKILPSIRWNPSLVASDGTVLPTPDGWIEDAGIALEVDSRSHHSSPDDWATTLRRHNLLSRYGAIVLHFTPREIRAEPPRVLRVMESTYVIRMTSPVTVNVFVRDPC